MRSGDAQLLTTTIFSESPGTVEWVVESGFEWVESLVSNPDNTGVLTTIEDEAEDHTIVIKAIHTPANNDSTTVRIANFEITSKKVIYATGGSIVGNATIRQIGKDTIFNLELTPFDYNGDYTTEWNLTGDSSANGNVIFSDTSNSSVTIRYIEKVIFESCILSAHVINKNGTVCDIELPITITDESVLMTSTSNPEVISICYAQGWCKSPDVMYKVEAQIVSSIGNVFQNSKIKTFNELAEFTNITELSNQAFFMCSELSEIALPLSEGSLQSIGSFALGYTKIANIEIPNTVVKIDAHAFDGTPIEEFKVQTGGGQYISKNGVLITAEGQLLKYPEGKTNSTYTTDEEIVSLGAGCIKNTLLRELTISDKVVAHGDSFLSSNKLLHTVNLGANIAPTNLAQHILENKVLVDINVSENHPSLSSQDGVLYDINKTILWKYPEGRSELTILPTVIKIGAYAMAQLSQFKSDLVMPDNIEYIDDHGLYACQSITGIIFNETSKLCTLGPYALQLLDAAKIVTFPATLRSIYPFALSNCSYLGNITFYGVDAPQFLDSYNQPSVADNIFGSGEYATGKKADTRTIYVPATSTSYESESWESLYSDSRY